MLTGSLVPSYAAEAPCGMYTSSLPNSHLRSIKQSHAAYVTQVSNDVRMVLPLLVAIIIAKWIADAVSHSLYHAILEVKCVPILHGNPQSRVSLDLIPVHHVMAYPVVIFQEQMPLTTVREILRDTRHNGFPVVRNTPQGQVSAAGHTFMCCSMCIDVLLEMHGHVVRFATLPPNTG